MTQQTSSETQHARNVASAVASNRTANSALISSWRRSVSFHGLDPADSRPADRISEIHLRETRQRLEPLIRATQGGIDRLFRAMSRAGCCVILADRDGVVLERRDLPSDNRLFSEWGLSPGAVWSEKCEGTNGIGTCLAEERLVTIHRDQHFYARNAVLSCTTAPIYDHEGNLAAALDVSSCRSDLSEDYIGLISIAVRETARKIEMENFRQAYPDARILMVPSALGTTNALIAADGHDFIIGATRAARAVLGTAPGEKIKSIIAADFISNEAPLAGQLWRAERAAIAQALLRVSGSVTAAAKSLGVSRSTLHRKVKRYGLQGKVS